MLLTPKLPKNRRIPIKLLDWGLQGPIQSSTTIDWRLVLVLPFPFHFFAFLAQIFHAHIAILNALPAALQGAGT
ncbi:LOW QUALITY PROTEIN: uncharacterized protein LOC26536067 [Drosophila yakuba]|uniref:LOW QUALITY PROTEIN: uncharacterized protein LOC26536067 n=1 Tax=Drosophila yakuba TaxID=7245 RepID=UPI0019307654|nr:LOW QUALITY PROTEIN: uncharacterized protein LOC26536067 [Drosophila yakuba]